MKLRIINPDSGIDETGLAMRCERLRPFVRPDTQLSMVCPSKNDLCIDSALDVALDAPEIVELALAAQAEGMDAVCLYCFSDPGFDACREALEIPVVGGAQSSVLLACQIANSYSVLVTSERRASQKRVFLRGLGGDPAKLASVRGVEIPPSSHPERGELVETLAGAALQCVKQDGADAVILGCLGFATLGAELTARVGVPVIDPAATMLTTAEALVTMGLCHSKASWPHPPKVERHWGAGRLEAF